MNPTWPRAALALYGAFWAGIVIGVSFIATIAKFSAPSLTRPVALEVGSYTFAMLARVEWGLAAVLALLLIAVAGINKMRAAFFLLLAGIILLQAFWLFPQLSARAAQVMAGQPLAPSPLHAISVAAESAKVLLLALFSVLEAKPPAK